ncbi:MAG: GNAT family N-acetyltransferase [Aeromicrobium sp.]
MNDAPQIGTRIVVRSLVGGTGPTGGPAMTDTVGRVLSIDAEAYVVERRDGTVHRVAVTDVVTWKQVPERPLRRRRAADVDTTTLTQITSRGWPPLQSEMLGDWELRAAGGFTGRANSVAAVGSPGMESTDAIAAVEAWYLARSAPPMAQVIVGSGAERDFLDAGWGPGNGLRAGALVQVADLALTYAIDPEVEVRTELNEQWLALYGRADEDMSAARAVISGPTTVGFAQLGDPIEAIARVVVTGEWAGIAAVEVLPHRREVGLATRLVSTCLAWAVERGADKAYLQTMRENTAALALYEPFGFVDHHDYRYLQSPSAHPQAAGRC